MRGLQKTGGKQKKEGGNTCLKRTYDVLAPTSTNSTVHQRLAEALPNHHITLFRPRPGGPERSTPGTAAAACAKTTASVCIPLCPTSA